MIFADALAFVLTQEGGYSNRAADAGGPTNHGVTQSAYDRWRNRKGLSTRDVQLIGDDEVATIYESDYWRAAACDKYGGNLGLAIFDFAVMSGVDKSVRFLQKALWIQEDGLPGVDTVGLANASDWRLVAYAHITMRRDWYRSLRDSAINPGWYGRLIRLRDTVLKEVPA